MDRKEFEKELEDFLRKNQEVSQALFIGAVTTYTEEKRLDVYRDWLKETKPKPPESVNDVLSHTKLNGELLEMLDKEKLDMIKHLIAVQIQSNNGMGFLFVLNVIDQIIAPFLRTNRTLCEALSPR